MEQPLVELKSVSKYFGSVIALKDVSFDVRPGEVHCLLGDNGAGKSTLIKVLSGVHLPDEGEILVGGTHTRFSSPKDTLDKGINL
jgi:simple sugar transport system ATP-binding protein